jgi:hypothetical protein
MNNHPLNLIVRFLLEIVLIFIFANWGWKNFEGVNKYLMSIGLPLLISLVWAVFKVEGDPGKAVLPIQGWLRLTYELFVFVVAAFLLYRFDNKWAFIFIILSIAHYLASYDRIVLLMKK